MSENSKSAEITVSVFAPTQDEIAVVAARINGKTLGEIAKELAAAEKEKAYWKEAAFLDPLTKVLNRRGMEAAFERITGVLEREGKFENYGVLFVDAVGLKEINDTLGETEGDKKLIGIAEAAKRTMKRDTDIVAKVGGDEFMLIVPNLSEDQLKDLVTRLLGNLPTGTELNVGACLWRANVELEEAFRRSSEVANSAKGLARQDKTGRSKEGFTVYFIDNG